MHNSIVLAEWQIPTYKLVKITNTNFMNVVGANRSQQELGAHCTVME
jgi:hypothetical protein